jgi:preprotein translocase subunit SecG
VESLILVVHIVVALGMIGLILLQQGKGAEAGASFGAGASNTVFGASGSANFLTKSTAFLTTIFFLTSLSLAYLAKKHAAELYSLAPLTSSAPATPPVAPAPAPATQVVTPATAPTAPPAIGAATNPPPALFTPSNS